MRVVHLRGNQDESHSETGLYEPGLGFSLLRGALPALSVVSVSVNPLSGLAQKSNVNNLFLRPL